jgi:hypothetical protein
MTTTIMTMIGTIGITITTKLEARRVSEGRGSARKPSLTRRASDYCGGGWMTSTSPTSMPWPPVV